MNTIESFTQDFQKTWQSNKQFVCQMKSDGDNEFVIRQVIYNRMYYNFGHYQRDLAWEISKGKVSIFDENISNRATSAKFKYDRKLYVIDEQKKAQFGLAEVLTPEQISFIEYKAKKKAYRDYFDALLKVASRMMTAQAKDSMNYRD